MPKNRGKTEQQKERQRKRTAANKIKSVKKVMATAVNEEHKKFLEERLRFWERQL